MTSTIVSLDKIVDVYLHDTKFLQARQYLTDQRLASMNRYTATVQAFINGTYSLDTFRTELKTLHQDTFWGAHSPGFLMALNQLANNHVPSNPGVEDNFRFILQGLNAQNVGQQIEQLYGLLMQEKIRLSVLGVQSNKIASPTKSAFIISLLAHWLNSTAHLHIFYPSLRTGLSALLNAKLLVTPTNISLNKDIEIKSQADYEAVTSVLDILAANQPSLRAGEYWSEHFLRWISSGVKKYPDFLEQPVFIDGPLPEIEDRDGGSDEDMADIKDEPLSATPEPLLTELIAQLRRHILIEERTVRAIYYALLGGHVILTGPPGTGKTELARLIPEILWQSRTIVEDTAEPTALTTRTAYTATLVTATADWSTRTLMSSIMPVVSGEKVIYETHYGHLIQAILRNWTTDERSPANWETAQRRRLRAKSLSNGQQEEEFHGHWLIIDEFNRASIDAALGEALTALSTGDALHLMTGGKLVKLPIPKDFRIIGTLNSFDRHYLQKMSEALKRRFSFIEILPPSRQYRKEEQDMVLRKALQGISHLSDNIVVEHAQGIGDDSVKTVLEVSRTDDQMWYDYKQDIPPFSTFYNDAWSLFEVVRLYRQLGTAQAIALFRQVFIQGILERYSTREQWETALDTALCNVIADQLQVILPDELDVVIWSLKLEPDAFIERYQRFIADLSTKRRRLSAHLEALNRVVNDDGQPLLSYEAIEQLLDEDANLEQLLSTLLTRELLDEAFHLGNAINHLPQFTRRLRNLKAEHGL